MPALSLIKVFLLLSTHKSEITKRQRLGPMPKVCNQGSICTITSQKEVLIVSFIVNQILGLIPGLSSFLCFGLSSLTSMQQGKGVPSLVQSIP